MGTVYTTNIYARGKICVLPLGFKNMDKIKEVDLVAELNLKSGKKIAFIGADNDIQEVDVIPTGILPLDFVLGIGGIPRGRITDIYGLPSVGKSSVCFTLIAQAQKKGLKCALVDAEYSYSPEYVRSFGVNTDTLLIIQGDCLEENADAIEATVRSGYGLVIIDSVSSLIPKALAEADHGKAPMAMQARGISSMLQKIVAPVAKNKTAVVCINQMRINIMAMHPGDKWTVTGGWALKFYSSIRIEMKKLKAILKKDTPIGYITGFKVVKNKLARPGLACEVPYLFDVGFVKDGDIVQMSVDKGLIEQQGAWFILEGEKYHGKDKVAAALEADLSLKMRLTSFLFPPENQQ